MKYLKYFLYALLGILVIYVLLCAIGPKDFNVTESTVIEAQAPIVFHLANSLQELEKWNEWSKSDTTIHTEYNDIYEGVGASSSWTSEVSGDGTQEIVESIPYTKVRSELKFKNWDGINYADINISEVGDKTNVSWSFEGEPLAFLFRGVALVTGLKGQMSTSYQKGLASLKVLAEQRAEGQYGDYQIYVKDVAEKHFVMNRQEVKETNIQQFYASNLGALFGKVQTAGAEMNGMPCGLYFKWGGKSGIADMAAAIPVSEPVSIKDVSSYSIPAQKAITLDFYGDYKTIGTGHSAVEKYMKDRNYLQDPPIIEEYVTDPGTEKDPNKWLTKITYYYSVPE